MPAAALRPTATRVRPPGRRPGRTGRPTC